MALFIQSEKIKTKSYLIWSICALITSLVSVSANAASLITDISGRVAAHSEAGPDITDNIINRPPGMASWAEHVFADSLYLGIELIDLLPPVCFQDPNRPECIAAATGALAESSQNSSANTTGEHFIASGFTNAEAGTGNFIVPGKGVADTFFEVLFTLDSTYDYALTGDLFGISEVSLFSSSTTIHQLLGAEFVTTPFDVTGILAAGDYRLYAQSRSEADAFGSLFTGVGSFNLALTLTEVPTPPAVWLFGSGLIGLIGVARKKKQ